MGSGGKSKNIPVLVSGWALGGVIAKTRQERESEADGAPPLNQSVSANSPPSTPSLPKRPTTIAMSSSACKLFSVTFLRGAAWCVHDKRCASLCDDLAIVWFVGWLFRDDRWPSRFPSPRSPTTGAPPHLTKMPGHTSQVVPAGPHNPVLDITPGKKQKKLKREPKRESNENRANKTT